MCFEKQHVKWLLETHVAFRGEDGWRIFVITDVHRLHPEPVTTQAAANRPGCQAAAMTTTVRAPQKRIAHEPRHP